VGASRVVIRLRALVDLLRCGCTPEVNREPGVRLALMLFAGVVLLFALDSVFHVH
jgi:hypothetical protein